ncbi:hypothetical protein VEGAS_73 [Paenibacillus phage Vegas]|uniref:Uncharacterized protein n=4 Tax=Vegasvirus vegas TaxID=2034999 RepID=A0A0K2CZ95_9CAUD|nr:hypothetical protein VEGAS_73 [Paenibacillus phage Vegas]ALA12736.1 hypothetical protein VEGAS_73 [Paenibacillus phage Vegas]ALA12820.1 hypothetical protein HAYLEY_71 [Paenibacillus phage Hayley]ALA12906.1 hypothetical protein VADIM_73 [Paenibacillus phage Vadim]ALA12990.1 hypothetical protein DIANE_73 [Paenibacillus phage Diane]
MQYVAAIINLWSPQVASIMVAAIPRKVAGNDSYYLYISRP